MNHHDNTGGTRRRWIAAATIILFLAVIVAVVVASGKSRRPPTGEPSVSLPSLPAVVGRKSSTQSSVAGLAAPVGAAQLAAAKRAAAVFLAAYLPYLYGRDRLRAIGDVSPSLRAGLAGHPPRVTPAQHTRHPRLIALSAVGGQAGEVLATATIADGSGVPYAIRLILERPHGRWLVTAIPA